VVEAFLVVSSQWRMACPGDGSITRTSLDYTAARAGWDMAGVAMTREMFDEVRMIEVGVRNPDWQGDPA
jgi:hypothetical protein